jgi:hypothetical protein
MSDIDNEIPVAPELTRLHKLVLWLVLALALIPAFLFIRAMSLEVSQYHVSTFEAYTREALAAGNYTRALGFCSGAMRAGVYRSDHWGKVYALEARAYDGLGQTGQALAKLEDCVDFWTKRYYHATDPEREEMSEFATNLGHRLLNAGDAQGAMRAFSAAGLGSGRPVDYLHGLNESLSAEDRSLLWGEDRPRLVVNDFTHPENDLLQTHLEEQGRNVLESRIDPAVSATGASSSYLELGPATSQGRSWYGVELYLPIPDRPFALRALIREDAPDHARIQLSYWFELARKSAATTDTATHNLADGWRRFDIERDFYAERLAESGGAYFIDDGIINKLSLVFPPGAARRVWIDRIELYLPEEI